MVSFEIFVKAMPPILLELKSLPSFCFAFKIPDDVAASINYLFLITVHHRIETICCRFWSNSQSRIIALKQVSYQTCFAWGQEPMKDRTVTDSANRQTFSVNLWRAKLADKTGLDHYWARKGKYTLQDIITISSRELTAATLRKTKDFFIKVLVNKLKFLCNEMP